MNSGPKPPNEGLLTKAYSRIREFRNAEISVRKVLITAGVMFATSVTIPNLLPTASNASTNVKTENTVQIDNSQTIEANPTLIVNDLYVQQIVESQEINNAELKSESNESLDMSQILNNVKMAFELMTYALTFYKMFTFKDKLSKVGHSKDKKGSRIEGSRTYGSEAFELTDFVNWLAIDSLQLCKNFGELVKNPSAMAYVVMNMFDNLIDITLTLRTMAKIKLDKSKDEYSGAKDIIPLAIGIKDDVKEIVNILKLEYLRTGGESLKSFKSFASANKQLIDEVISIAKGEIKISENDLKTKLETIKIEFLKQFPSDSDNLINTSAFMALLIAHITQITILPSIISSIKDFSYVFSRYFKNVGGKEVSTSEINVSLVTNFSLLTQDNMSYKIYALSQLVASIGGTLARLNKEGNLPTILTGKLLNMVKAVDNFFTIPDLDAALTPTK